MEKRWRFPLRILDLYSSQTQHFEVKHVTQLFTSQDVNCWTGCLKGSVNTCALVLTLITSLHSLVIDTLKEVDPSRKCFRLVGGVLVERTVKEVLPALENNKEQV